MGPRAIEVPAGGSFSGDSTTARRPIPVREGDLAHRLSVHVRAVAAAEIGERVGAMLELELAVVPAHQRIVDDDVVVARAADADQRATQVELDRGPAAGAD